MRYNILTVCNEGYIPFLDIFVKSLFKNCDSDNLVKLYIFDTGIDSRSRDLFKIYPKIQIVETDKKTEYTKIHDDDWYSNVHSKTDYLYQTINHTKTPTFMIDVDCVFQKPFEEYINEFAEIVVCHRPNSHICSHIASFFGAIDIEKSMLFIKIWQEVIKTINTKTKESPALTEVLRLYNENFRIQNINEFYISCVKDNPDAFIYHLKSDGFAQTIDERLKLKYAQNLINSL